MLNAQEWFPIDNALRKRYQLAQSAIERECVYSINMAVWMFCEAYQSYKRESVPINRIQWDDPKHHPLPKHR